MYRILYKCLAVVAFALVLFSCGTSRKAQGDADMSKQTESAVPVDYFYRVVNNASKAENLTAKVKVTVSNGKKTISTSGTLRMKKNDVVQISLVDPIIGIAEVGRMEFTKDKMLVIDRVNRRYVSVAYNNIGFLKNAKVDFYALQALFWNEIFEPGKKEPEEKAFSLKKNRNTVNLNYSDSMLAYDFETSLDDARLHKTSVDDNGVKKYSLSCSYSDFTDFEGGMFPKNIKLTFNGGKETMSLSMQLSSLRNESGWLARTTVPSKYSSVKPEDILKMLVK